MSYRSYKAQDIVENPKSIFFFLSDSEKDELMQSLFLTQYKRNEMIFREGEKPTGFLYLVDGKAKIYKEGVAGREQIIRMEKSLRMIGYRAVLAGEKHIASAITLEESLIATISSDFVFNRAMKNPVFTAELIRRMAHELGFSHNRTVSLTQKHIRGRLAETLILLRDKYGFEKDKSTLKVYISREDIANLSNMTTSNAIRTLSSLASENIIAIDGRNIKILDMDRLERVSKLG